MIPHSRDPLGVERLYLREDGTKARTVRALVQPGSTLDRDGVRWAWGHGGDATRSCIRGIRRAVRGTSLAPTPADGELRSLLEHAIARVLSGPGRVALCLSGGLDSAWVLACALELGARPSVYILSSRLGDTYDETAAALQVAAALGVQPIVVHATARDFVDALPSAIRHAETCLYNLHPVSKLLLARRLAEDGISVALTGDGADEVFALRNDDDYLPIAAALTESAGVSLASPFFDPAVIAYAQSRTPDPGKKELRAVASSRLPRAVIETPKRPRFAPPIDVSTHLDETRAARLAQAMDVPLRFTTDAERVGWTTLSLLCDMLELDV